MEWGVNDRYEVGCNEGSECSISSRVLIHLPAKINIASLLRCVQILGLEPGKNSDYFCDRVYFLRRMEQLRIRSTELQ